MSNRICNRNYAILSRLGVTSIPVKDVIFEGAEIGMGQFDPSLEHHNSVIFASILKKLVRFE